MIFEGVMKFFLVLMIFALAFGSFSAASHAFGAEDCGSSSVQSKDCANDFSKIDHHDQSQKKADKGLCLDCHHCCLGSFILPVNLSWNDALTGPDYVSRPSPIPVQAKLTSLLRPPKTLA